MKRSYRRWWLLFGAGVVGVGAALAGITRVTLELESSEAKARADADHQESLRLALWRLDSWLTPRLAAEAARPPSDYQPYTKQTISKRRSTVVVPSPLIAFESDLFPLHFQYSTGEGLTSPQVPRASDRLPVADLYTPVKERLEMRRRLLERVAGIFAAEAVRGRVLQAEQDACVALSAPAELAVQQQVDDDLRQQESSGRGRKEQLRRMQNTIPARQAPQQLSSGKLVLPQGTRRGGSAIPGPLVPLWLGDGAGERDLYFLRRVVTRDEELLQGFLADWEGLRTSLLEQIDDLFPRASVAPVLDGALDAAASSDRMATIPLSLAAERTPGPPAAGRSPARLALLVTWIVALLAVFIAALSLRASIAYGERRSRFASAVTHELRTPLTTFQLYSEMLAEDMVRDPEQRRLYLETLRREAGRLGALVENVLAYARLEEGRRDGRTESLSLAELLARVLPPLERRCHSAGLRLVVERHGSPEGPVTADVEAVAQILFNLVDNACKYAGGEEEKVVNLEARLAQRQLRLTVRDHGAGIPAAAWRDIFVPFDRGGRESGKTPGVGLGLALSRGLAHDLGGDLTLDGSGPGGTSFTLTLPLPPPEPQASP
ncbi:MAG: sensor histidine kinase [Planctomycetota bacterium]